MTINLDETTYLNAARAGDQEAFAQLIDPYRRQLLLHCYRILGSFEDAEDMFQETLVRVWKRLNSSKGARPCAHGCTKLPPTLHWMRSTTAVFADSPKRYIHAAIPPGRCRPRPRM